MRETNEKRGKNDMHTAICAFNDRARAEQAVDALVRTGIARHDVHIEHKKTTAEGRGSTQGGLPGPEGDDRNVLSSFGHFFASLLGRDNPSDHVDTYSQHVERGGYVVVVDADDEAQAQRARTLLQEMQGGDLNVVQRSGEQRRVRDIVGATDEPAGMVERSRQAYESGVGESPIERERAMAASHRLETRTGPDLRAPDVSHAPGLRYADKDKPE
jgi:hypothetical protein